MSIFGLPGYQEILIISILLSLLMAILTKILTNQDEIKRAKREMQFYQDKVKKAQASGDKDTVAKLSNDMLKASGKQLKQSMKPMFISLIIFAIAFWWLGTTYAEIVILIPFPIPFIGAEFNWFWWYLVVVLPTGFLFRKIMDVQ